MNQANDNSNQGDNTTGSILRSTRQNSNVRENLPISTNQQPDTLLEMATQVYGENAQRRQNGRIGLSRNDLQQEGRISEPLGLAEIRSQRIAEIYNSAVRSGNIERQQHAETLHEAELNLHALDRSLQADWELERRTEENARQLRQNEAQQPTEQTAEEAEILHQIAQLRDVDERAADDNQSLVGQRRGAQDVLPAQDQPPQQRRRLEDDLWEDTDSSSVDLLADSEPDTESELSTEFDDRNHNAHQR